MRVYDLQAEKLVTEQGERVYSPNNKPSWDDVNSKPDFAMLQAVRGKAQFEQMRQQNNDKYAASGFVHHGKHRNNGSSEVPINEGLFTATYGSNSNTLFSGNKNENFKVGKSKTDFAVTQIAGIVSTLINQDGNYSFKYKLPEAPDGTVVYDSSGDCRGTGKPNLDLSKEVDPKYGDIAADRNEAVARAFEGMAKNGDLRLGDDGSWVAPYSESGWEQTINVGYIEAIQTEPTYKTQSIQYNVPDVIRLKSGVTYRMEAGFEIVSGEPDLTRVGLFIGQTPSDRDNKAGRTLSDEYSSVEVGKTYKLSVDLTADADAARPRFRIGVSGSKARHLRIRNISVRPITEEVVTERVDLVGLEFYLEEVTKDNPFVYPNGCIQSQAATMNGITTTRSNRPDTYYAVYDGDTSSVGKGVDFWSATSEEKVKMVSDASNNLFNFGDDLVPKIVQWRVRQRSIAGAGNGDWSNVDPTLAGSAAYLKCTNTSLVTAQGSKDVPLTGKSLDGSSNAGRNFQASGSTNSYWENTRELGLFNLGNGNSAGHNGECYFYVIATVPRLNQGAYHPTLNPLGTRAHVVDSPNAQASAEWYKSNARKPTTTGNCFLIGSYSGTTGYPGDAGYARDTTGYLGHIGTIARPDGRFYDAIYSSGQGGVIDHRPKYGAWDASRPEQADEVLSEVVGGVYRGKEKLPKNGVTVFLPDVKTTSTGGIYLAGGAMALFDEELGITRTQYMSPANAGNLNGVNWLFFRKSDKKLFKPTLWLNGYHLRLEEWDGNSWVQPGGNVSEYETEYFGIWYFGKFDRDSYPADSLFYTRIPADGVYGQKYSEGAPLNRPLKNISVSGEFLQTDLIGDPTKIFNTPLLKDGWVGNWVPVIPDDTVKYIDTSLVRKCTASESSSITTNDGGLSFSEYTLSIDNTVNAINSQVALPSNQVRIVNYTAFAKQTKQSTNKIVFNRRSGLLPVIISAYYEVDYGVLLSESTLGKILTSSGVGVVSKYHNLSDVMFKPSGLLTSLRSRYSPRHFPLDMEEPNNSTVGFKILPHQVDDNHQASLNFIANELKHNGTDWGDDGTVKVIENGTYTNENSETCLADIHTLAIPYGHIRQK